MTSLNRMMTFAVLVPGALVLGGCASLGIHDTQSLLVPSVPPLRDRGLHRRVRHHVRGDPRPGHDDQAPVEPGHQPDDGEHHGRVSDCLDLLRPADRVASRDRLERRRVVTNSLTIWAYRAVARRERQETGGHLAALDALSAAFPPVACRAW